MEVVIICILLVVVILNILVLTKSINESNITERLGKMETNMIREIGEFKNGLSRDITVDFDKNAISDNYKGTALI